MATDENTPKKQEDNPVEQQVSNLLGYLRTPIKQVQEWVNSGQFQSTIENLQGQAERAQEGVERRLRALNEVRQGVQIHVKKQLEAYQQQGRQETTDPAPAPQPEPEATRQPRPKAKGPGKKARGKKGSGRKG
jgi:hypothetical protein